MPKMKTHSGAKKRLRKTASGKVKRKKSGLRHILSNKTTKRKRGLRQATFVSSASKKKVDKMLPYG